MTDLSKWLSARDAARRLDLSDTYVRRLMASGTLRTVRTRLGNLVDPESVVLYAAGRQARAKDQAPRMKKGA